MEVRSGGGTISMTLRLADHRPPELPRAAVTVTVGGAAVPLVSAPVEGKLASTDYSFEVTGSPARVVIETDTWNPASLEGGGRDEELGVSLERVGVREGSEEKRYEIVEAQPAPTYYPAPLWYYDLRTAFAADLWPVYLAEARMGLRGALALGLPTAVIAVAAIVLGTLGWRKAGGRAQRGLRGEDLIG
jgi:hypothetical protein